MFDQKVLDRMAKYIWRPGEFYDLARTQNVSFMESLEIKLPYLLEHEGSSNFNLCGLFWSRKYVSLSDDNIFYYKISQSNADKILIIPRMWDDDTNFCHYFFASSREFYEEVLTMIMIST